MALLSLLWRIRCQSLGNPANYNATFYAHVKTEIVNLQCELSYKVLSILGTVLIVQLIIYSYILIYLLLYGTGN